MNYIELLSPAKNLECGIEAINHGADAIYIGAPKFGARTAAGNSIVDIEKLVDYAHQYNVRIYIALNTILKDDELQDVEMMIWQLYNAGVDALIIQDMGILEMNLPPIALHASTQMNNRTLEKIEFLEQSGFSQIVLARELSLKKIAEIAKQTATKLEVFVHGALCVSYSGQCYLSEAFCGRSANRGECAQYCRLPYTLQDANGNTILAEKHLLSLRDMNRSAYLQQLIEAGVSSFKIEGRLKDITYVKNVTAYYRKTLDSILNEKPHIQSLSSGKCHYFFEPDPRKSFNRGFTDYFLTERKVDITSFDTPKSMGEHIGMIKYSTKDCIVISGKKRLHNGDGLCFIKPSGEFSGFRVNRVDNNRIFPFELQQLPTGTHIYRNYDKEFEDLLSKKSAERKIFTKVLFAENPIGFTLSIYDEDNNHVSLNIPFEKTAANKPQTENIKKLLQKSGDTIFEVTDVSTTQSHDWFIPASTVSAWRRKLIEQLLIVRKINYKKEIRKNIDKSSSYPEAQLTYLGNVSNKKSRAFYQKSGVKNIAPAFEFQPEKGQSLMFTKHCIKYSLGLCSKYRKNEHKSMSINYTEPFYLIHSNYKLKLMLEFDCTSCEMKVIG